MDIFSYKLLVVDDNKELLSMIKGILEEEGYHEVVSAGSVREGMEVFRSEHPDIALLNVMLPDGDGFTLFQRIRMESDIPILFLSAKDEDEDRLFGLGLGADDYITKPFLPKELLLRVQAILKRTYSSLRNTGEDGDKTAENIIRMGEHEIFPDQAVVKYKGGEIPLTAKELSLFLKLYQNRGKIVTFDALCNAVWGDSYYGYENTLMVHIRRLREKIEKDASHPERILTARGLGYRLVKEQVEE